MCTKDHTVTGTELVNFHEQKKPQQSVRISPLSRRMETAKNKTQSLMGIPCLTLNTF